MRVGKKVVKMDSEWVVWMVVSKVDRWVVLRVKPMVEKKAVKTEFRQAVLTVDPRETLLAVLRAVSKVD